ncbi:hypothetical protein SLS57_002301 [Botryosphaeria dothidea]
MAYVVDSNKGSQPWGYSTLDDFGDVITGKTDQSNWYSGKEEEAGGEAESALGNDATTREDAIAAATTLQEFVAWGRVLFAARWPGLAHTVDILKRTIDGSRRSEPPPHAIWTALPPRPAAAAAAASSSFWPPFDKTDPDPAVRLLARLAEPKRYALVDPWKRGTAAHMLGVVRDVEAYAHPTSKELIGGLDELEVVAAVVLLAGRSAEDDASALRRKLDRLLAVTGVGFFAREARARERVVVPGMGDYAREVWFSRFESLEGLDTGVGGDGEDEDLDVVHWDDSDFQDDVVPIVRRKGGEALVRQATVEEEEEEDAEEEEEEEEEEAAAEGTAERDGGLGTVDGVTEDARRLTEKALEINNSHVKNAAAGQEASIRSEEMVAERQRTAATREQRITDDKGMLDKRGRKPVSEKENTTAPQADSVAFSVQHLSQREDPTNNQVSPTARKRPQHPQRGILEGRPKRAKLKHTKTPRDKIPNYNEDGVWAIVSKNMEDRYGCRLGRDANRTKGAIYLMLTDSDIGGHDVQTRAHAADILGNRIQYQSWKLPEETSNMSQGNIASMYEKLYKLVASKVRSEDIEFPFRFPFEDESLRTLQIPGVEADEVPKWKRELDNELSEVLTGAELARSLNPEKRETLGHFGLLTRHDVEDGSGSEGRRPEVKFQLQEFEQLIEVTRRELRRGKLTPTEILKLESDIRHLNNDIAILRGLKNGRISTWLRQPTEFIQPVPPGFLESRRTPEEIANLFETFHGGSLGLGEVGER